MNTSKPAYNSVKSLALLAGVMLLPGCASGPSIYGVSDEGYLKPCPSSPNCVSSFEENSHGVRPFKLAVEPDQAIPAIADALNSLPRVRIVAQDERYLRAEFTSAVFRFVDDLEFYARDTGTLGVRSASRVGYSDLGANRRRVENLRALLQQKAIIR